MSEAEKRKLLNDKWPPVSKAKKKVIIRAINRASKSGVFDYDSNEKELIAEK